MTGRRRVAVVGSGVAGLTAAYVASRSAHVTLFEADDRLGGHADTHVVPTATGPVPIDTGFIVHNERTYPTLLRLFAELGVPTQESDMSMSIRSDAAHRGAGLEWAGALGASGVFPTWRNAVRPSYLRMLTEIPKFHRRAKAVLASAEHHDERDQTLAEFLDAGHFSAYFRRHFMKPVVAAVWSCDPELSLDYPARYLFAFLEHHGMLRIFGSPVWRTVTGGSKEYVDRIAAALVAHGGDIRTGTKVTSVLETASGVEITDGNGDVHAFDAAVVAAHPGQALGLLAEPTAAQRELLGAMPYSPNLAQLHTDTSLLPKARRAWASWNHLERPGRDGVTVTYDMTRLMRLPEQPDGTRYLVTLGAPDLVDPARVIATMDYEHPIYTPESVAAQRRLAEIDSDRLVFAGAWQGWGFHEDGARSGAHAAERLGLGWDPSPEAPGTAAAPVTGVYETTISHTRRTPLKHRFSTRSHTWLVDLDQLPAPGVLGRFFLGRFFLGSFEARDHLGAPDGTIRANLEAFLARHDLDATGGRILMATQARAFGYCFNPITVFWVRDRAGAPLATVVEVHNTYGDRHAYLVHPDADGRATTPKAMYVSPFHGTDGVYDLVVPEPGADGRLRIAVRLTTDEGEVFDASLTGRRSDRGALRAAPAAARGALLIRLHGIFLWVRRLPVRPRPTHHQEGVTP